MFTIGKFRDKALAFKERGAASGSVSEKKGLAYREKTFSDLADNEQWLSDNHDKMIHSRPAPAPAGLADEEAHVLRCLGAALVMHWNMLPTEIKRELFDTAGAMGDAMQTEELRGQIARFVHRYKDGDAALVSTSRREDAS